MVIVEIGRGAKEAGKSWSIKKQLEIQIAKLEEASSTQMAVNKRSQLSLSVTHD